MTGPTFASIKVCLIMAQNNAKNHERSITAYAGL